jgi:hypothetical protein
MCPRTDQGVCHDDGNGNGNDNGDPQERRGKQYTNDHTRVVVSITHES